MLINNLKIGKVKILLFLLFDDDDEKEIEYDSNWANNF